MTTYTADQGAAFGTWDNDTSRLMYRDCMPALLNGVDTSVPVYDLGGANGLLRQFIPHAVTVDVDASKAPDVVADARYWAPEGPHAQPPLAVLRYVLHYMPDQDVLALFSHLATWAGRALVVQFVTDADQLAAKTHNSVNEQKWFRDEDQLAGLFAHATVLDRKRLDYTVQAEFYRLRLGHPNPVTHREAIVAYHLGF